MDTPKCFFHYTTREAAFGHILPSRKLRFSPYEQMRDPMENKEWSWRASWPVDNPDLEAEDPLEEAFFYFQELARKIRLQAHLLALTVDAPDYPAPAEEFAKGWARARMWEQYAENHEGICLVFDREALEASLTHDLERQLGFGPYHRQVQYDAAGSAALQSTNLQPASWPMNFNGVFVEKYIEDHFDELFFKKTLDWQTEYEYRFVTTASPEQPLYAAYGDAMRGIVLGEQFPDWQLPAAIEASTQAGVELMAMSWHGRAPTPNRVT